MNAFFADKPQAEVIPPRASAAPSQPASDPNYTAEVQPNAEPAKEEAKVEGVTPVEGEEVKAPT